MPGEGPARYSSAAYTGDAAQLAQPDFFEQHDPAISRRNL